MNLIFLTLSRITDINNRGIYTDLMRKFRDEGHQVYIVSPSERRYGMPTSISKRDSVTILSVKTLNIQKTNVVEKGLGTLLLETQFKRAIIKKFRDVRFDLILYSTPPITLTSVVKYLKERNPNAVSYLLLKDIFPQNAVDLRMISNNSLAYKMFRKKEKMLYKLSDYIGCMSPANVEYVLKNNTEIDSKIVEVNPNSIDAVNQNISDEEKREIRKKYGLPLEKTIFIYGGNLGKPQGIGFLIKCLEGNISRNDCHFLIVGNGTEYEKLEKWIKERNPHNVSLHKRLSKKDYDLLVQSCDVGLIFLDHRFSIPNYPSRLLSYLENRMPILAATDPNTDIGRIAVSNGYGMWCESNNVAQFTKNIDAFVKNPEQIKIMGEHGYQFLLQNYQVETTYRLIVEHLNIK